REERQWLTFLLCSGAGLTMNRRIGRTPLIKARTQAQEGGLNFLFRSGARLTMSRRIGRAPRISETTPRARQARCWIDAASPISRRARSQHWIKVKNPSAPAVKRSAEEDWGSRPTGEVSKR